MNSAENREVLTKELLESVLSSYHRSESSAANVQILTWTSEEGSDKNEGYLSEQVRATVQYVAEGEENSVHLIFKILPRDQDMLSLIHENQFVFREVNFYTKVLPALKKIEKAYLSDEDLAVPWAPKFFYGNADEWEKTPLVLEDLCPKGYRVVSSTEGLSYGQAKSALVAIANFHAASLALEVKEGKSLPERFPFLFPLEKAVECFHRFLERSLPFTLKFLEVWGDRQSVRESVIRYFNENDLKDVLRRSLAPSGKLLTLLHYDIWSHNLLIKGDGEDAHSCIIDWQMLAYGRPAFDVSTLIWSSLTPTVRRQYGETLRSDYWEAFTSRLAKFGLDVDSMNYTKDDLEADSKVADLVSALVLMGCTESDEGSRNLMEKDVELVTDLVRRGLLD